MTMVSVPISISFSTITTTTTGFFCLAAAAARGGGGGATTGRKNTPRSRKLPKKPNPNVTTRRPKKNSLEFPAHRNGGDATTYDRLPPRDDFVATFPANPIFNVVALSDSAKSLSLGQYSEDNGDGDDDDDDFVGTQQGGEEDEEEVIFDSIGFDFGEFSDSLSGEASVSDDNPKKKRRNDEDDQVVMFEEGEEFEEDGTFEEEGEEREKEKGVPAVMRCFDRAKIYVKAGNGGNGVVAFRREKFVPFGGPSGGDGGRGGNVYVEVDDSMNSLLPFRKNIHFRAGRGFHGQGKKQIGAKGESIVVKVAPGTVIREAGKDGNEGRLLLELLHPGQRALLLSGGKGGRGNASFKSGTNKVPKIAENGEEGPEMWLELELKLVADVGIVGAPNAGKSTLLSVISGAQPAIANYPFTTLLPNLGVVSLDYDATMVVADLPGLLEGAHRGFGLGHEFLRHTERCSVLVHVVDGSGPQPEYEFDAVRLELELFNPELSLKPFLVAYNKMDLPEAHEKWISFKHTLEARGVQPFCMSAVNRQGTAEIVSAAYELLRKKKEVDKEPEGWTEHLNMDHVADTLRKQRNASINDFEISHDSSSRSWYVDGAGIHRFVQMTNWNYSESSRRFQHVLEACGVYKSLIKLGVKEGDRVIVGEMEMVWHDSNNISSSSNMKKGMAGTVKWK